MTDREAIELLADFVGLKGEWVQEHEPHIYHCVGFHYGEMFEHIFDPLHDGNDERMVIEEAMRSFPTGRPVSFVSIYDPVGTFSHKMAQVLHESKQEASR